jgi:hypothetical protein
MTATRTCSLGRSISSDSVRRVLQGALGPKRRRVLERRLAEDLE